MVRREAQRAEEGRALAMFVGGAVVAATLAALLGTRGSVAWPPPPAAAWLVPTAALTLVFLAGNLAMQYGAARLPANRTAVVMLTEVVFASLSAVAARRRRAHAAPGARRQPDRRRRAARGAPAGRRARAMSAGSVALPSAFRFDSESPMAEPAHTIHDFEALSIGGRAAQLASQRGKVLLIVNTASQCGFTPQFAGLEALWQQYRDRGLVVIGFPSNQFGAQDPGSNDEIATFCQANYGVSFPMMAKVDVNGDQAHPLWKWLTAAAPGILGTRAIKWNFTKFLVGKDGKVLKRYAPTDSPESLKGDIETALAA